MDPQLSPGQEAECESGKFLIKPKKGEVWSATGAVLGPILFLVYIADLQLGDAESRSKILKFVDDSKVLTRTTCDEDVARLQDKLIHIYGWAGQNHMKWNDLKF